MEEALHRLQEATEVAPLKAAILNASPFNTPAHPEMQVAMEEALRRLSHATRVGQLTISQEGPIPIERQPSHDERMRLMMEMRLKRSLGMSVAATEDAMRHMCYDTYCATCASESPKYQAICVNFMLECISVRFSERLQFDRKNKYRKLPGFPADLTAAMERYVANPIRFWLHETTLFYTLGDRLVELHGRLIKPSAVGDNAKIEARKYGAHVGSIQQVIKNIRKCDASPL